MADLTSITAENNDDCKFQLQSPMSTAAAKMLITISNGNRYSKSALIASTSSNETIFPFELYFEIGKEVEEPLLETIQSN